MFVTIRVSATYSTGRGGGLDAEVFPIFRGVIGGCVFASLVSPGKQEAHMLMIVQLLSFSWTSYARCGVNASYRVGQAVKDTVTHSALCTQGSSILVVQSVVCNVNDLFIFRGVNLDCQARTRVSEGESSPFFFECQNVFPYASDKVRRQTKRKAWALY